MHIQFKLVLLFFWIVLSQTGSFFQSQFASAEESTSTQIRWTGSEDTDASFSHILARLNKKLNRSLSEKDFVLQEDRDLAFNHYKRWVQVIDQVPSPANVIRLWTQSPSHQVVQLEANFENPQGTDSGFDSSQFLDKNNNTNSFSESFSQLGFNTQQASSKQTTAKLRESLTSDQTLELIRPSVQSYVDDPYLRSVDWKDEWSHGKLIRRVRIKGKRGTHQIRISLKSKSIVSHDYREFPQADFSIPVEVYPIYEEVENGDGTVLDRVPAELKHLLQETPQINGDIYAPLKNQTYYEFKLNPTLGATEEGRAQGYWSFDSLKEQASQIRSQLSLTENSWKNGVLLQGQYATINIHPEALEKFKPKDFQAEYSSALFFDWADATFDGYPTHVMNPMTSFSGKRLYSPSEALQRPARRLPNHDPAEYMRDGFDELQVYYAIDTLFEVLHERGFSDPELSTRPFNAFLFNPDIAYRDNAFYTDDSINFTTYSPKAGNAARDNSTIWHELGHGVMDRLMGGNIELADTGGLSEGMADFVAALVVEAKTQGTPFPGSDKFRIINRTGFYFTNEVHDDGEAYGGAMKDFLDAVIQVNGSSHGLNQVADVVLETMRLTRDYPGLTATEWFKHLLFADSMGREGLRQPGELSPYLLKSLTGRNFRLDGGEVAAFSLTRFNPNPKIKTPEEIGDGSPGSRERPIRVNIGKKDTASFKLQAKLKSSDEFKFHYPVEIRLQYLGSPLQGAIHWIGKEKGPQSFVLKRESDRIELALTVSGTCDEVNRLDGSCVDYAEVLVFDGKDKAHPKASASTQPIAKKRFYLRISNSDKKRQLN